MQPATGGTIDLKLYQVVAESMRQLHPAFHLPAVPIEKGEIPSELATTDREVGIALGRKAR